MVNDKQFLSSFPFLKSIGIETIKEVKEKLIFEGKVNSADSKEWLIIGISYSPYNMTELKLSVKNGHEKFKIIYKEVTREHKGKRLPSISSREPSLVKQFKLLVKVPDLEYIQDSDNIEFFQLKKAS